MTRWNSVGIVDHWPIYPEWPESAIVIDETVSLTSTPIWISRNSELAETTSFNHRQTIAESRFILSSLYDAEALGDPDPSWPYRPLRSKQMMARERLVLANLAFWLCSRTRLSIRLFVDFDLPTDLWNIRSVSDSLPLRALELYVNEKLDYSVLPNAIRVYKSLISFPPGSNMRTATITLWKALTENEWETRYMLLWIALEAIFGSSSPSEVNYRLRLRISNFHSTNRDQALELMRVLSDCYTWRSKTVHGRRLSGLAEQKSIEIMDRSEDLLRISILKISLSNDLINLFNGPDRDSLLDDLVLQNW